MNEENHLPPVIKAMHDPSFFGIKNRQDIQLIQTHISFVILTPDFAYKIKKPYDLGFLNFEKLEDRKFYCDEELRLNNRLAPKLYIDVIPIYKTGDTYSLNSGNSSEVVEYAVKMYTFDNDLLLSHMSEKGDLKRELFKDLGKEIATFHTEIAESDDKISSNGKPENVKEVAGENEKDSEKYISDIISQEQFKAFTGFTNKKLAELKPLIEKRVSSGYVKNCHGDLHLRNICIYEDEIQIFDCIEFTKRYRHIDVYYDLSFLIMDLQYRNLDLYTAILLTAYLEKTADYDGIKLLPLFACMRAVIRGKVTGLITLDDSAGKQEKEEAKETSAAYYRLCERYYNPSPGKVILMHGVSGSGKSYIAKKIGSSLPFIHLRSDVIRKQLAEKEKLPNTELYHIENTLFTYNYMISIINDLSNQGYHCIADATFLDKEIRSHTIKNITGETRIVACEAPKETLIDRVKNRKSDVSDADVRVLLDQLEKDYSLNETEREKSFYLRTDIADSVDTVMSQIQGWI